jgi:hypothetical protein
VSSPILNSWKEIWRRLGGIETRIQPVDGIIALTAFLFHFIISWRFSYPSLRPDVILVIIEPLQSFMAHPVFVSGLTQVNYFTGAPLMLLPFLELAGYSPANLRLTMVLLISLSTPVLYLAFRQLWSLRKSLLLTALLLNLDLYLLFRYVDYTYTLLAVSVLILVFSSWLREPSRWKLYSFAFLIGAFFYLKAITLYVSAALVLGYLIDRKTKVLQRHSWKQYGVAFALLVAGASPFIAMSIGMDFFYLDRVTGVEDNYFEASSPAEVVETRIDQVNYILWPEASIKDSSFQTPPHIGTLLLLESLLVFLIPGRRNFLYSFFLVFIFLLYVTSGLDFRQVMIIIPVVMMMYGQALERFNARKMEAAAVLLLVSTALLSAPTSLEAGIIDERRDSFTVTQSGFLDYKKTVEGETVVTNFHNLYYLASYDTSRKEYLAASPWEERARRENAPTRAGRRNIREIERIIAADDTSIYLLDEEVDCSSLQVRGCGYTTDYLVDRLDLKNYSTEYVGDYRYKLYHLP